jgi:hypothetical protein
VVAGLLARNSFGVFACLPPPPMVRNGVRKGVRNGVRTGRRIAVRIVRK